MRSTGNCPRRNYTHIADRHLRGLSCGAGALAAFSHLLCLSSSSLSARDECFDNCRSERAVEDSSALHNPVWRGRPRPRSRMTVLCHHERTSVREGSAVALTTAGARSEGTYARIKLTLQP